MNCIPYAPLLIAGLCIFMSSPVQTYEIIISHEFSVSGEVIVTWWKDRKFSHDRTIQSHQRDSVSFGSYEDSTLYEIALTWIGDRGVRYRSRFVCVFEGYMARLLGSKNSYLLSLKDDGAYYSRDGGAEKMLATWSGLERNVYEIRLFYENWGGRILHVKWFGWMNHNHESILEPNSPHDACRFDLHEGISVSDGNVTVKWKMDGVVYETEQFTIFSYAYARAHPDLFIYYWYFKEGGVYFTHDVHGRYQKFCCTWSSILLK